MIRITLDIEKIDYDAIIKRYLESKQKKSENSGGIFGKLKQNAIAKVATGAIEKTSEEEKIEIVKWYLEGHKEKIISQMEDMAEENGIKMQFGNLTIENVKE